jgi:hypothetical protein
MNNELATEGLPLAVQILGINPVGYEAGNADMCLGRDLPWLQETGGGSVENAWGATFRDVVILDAENKWITAYNLTTNPLTTPANYQELKSLLRTAAMSP